MKTTALNRWERARKYHRHAMLSQSVEAQEEAIVNHYVSFSNLAMRLRSLIELRRKSKSQELDETIRYLTDKIREGHMMEFGIELEWRKNESD